ncbi:MAG: hypothetical protein QGH46_05255 [Gammaproteobacteria bacterium]|nr:hypothetical protein [Gammaproteobacteria bacterium]MDP7271365.1 hypothetical protein [Gammaproteobacteria bacterium]HJP05146.1 hypothetical protein [Gammaproteobacteria bacterium]
MNTAELQFNIIYTPGTVRYLTPFVTTLLKWCDCSFRLVANGCSGDECKLLEGVAALDDRLELLTMPGKRMLPHGETLDFLHARTDSEWFCFMDSDILAVGPFMDDFRDDLKDSDLFSSCLPLWHNDKDITIPKSFRHMHGIHAYTDTGITIACDYFVIYNKKTVDEACHATGVGLAVCSWNDLTQVNQAILRDLGQERADYDSAKALTLLMADRGARIHYKQSDKLKHIGGFTEVGAIEGALLYTRGRIDNLAGKLPGALGHTMLRIADAWYALKLGPAADSWQENRSFSSRLRRRAATARYFYLLIIGLMDDKPVPKVPNLGDPAAELRVAIVSDEIRELIGHVRTQPGPWQD